MHHFRRPSIGSGALRPLLLAAMLAVGVGWAQPTTAAGANPPAANLVAVAYAKAQLGKPYQWGGSGPDAYDCSGLTYASYRYAGITIPRTSVTQYPAGAHVPLASLLPGDLVFYGTDVTNPATIYHVSMYVGGGSTIDAPHAGTVVQIRPMYATGLLPYGTRPYTPTGLRIGAPSSIYYGQYAVVGGRLVSAITGAPVAGLPVSVYARRVGNTTWSLLATLPTDSTGMVRYARAIGGDAQFGLWFPGAVGYRGAASPYATVLVRPAPTAIRAGASPTTISLGQTTTVGGRLVSALTGAWQAGQPVRVYARRLGTPSWTQLATLTTGADGMVTYTRAIGGSAEFLLTYPGAATMAATASPVLRVYVR